jgi:8-oxo-dGTP diphosphatase
MIRDTIRKSVEQIVPVDELETMHRQDVLNWIDSGADLFRVEKPDVPPKHLVSYFMLADLALRKVLLVHHKKANLWLPTGGHVELDEDPAETVRRECLEELGVDAKFVQTEPQFVTVTNTVNTNHSHTDVSLWYILQGNESQQLEWDREEFHDIRWWTIDEVESTPVSEFDPHLHRFISKVKDTK